MVKGVRFGEYRDVGHPVTTAKVYDAQGADELLFLDITATREERPVLLDVVSRTADECFMPLTVGGGVRSIADAERLLLAGADKIAVNTAAIRRPELVRDIAERFGNQAIVCAVDAKRTGAGWEVFSHGGRTPEGLDALDWCKRVADLGAGEILLTSMDRDGTGLGYDLELIRAVATSVSVPVIASGGVGNLDHLADGIQQGGADAVLAASIFHYGEYTVGQAKQRMAERGIPVRT